MENLIALAETARGGDRAALEALLEASAGLAHSVARARLGNSLAAEGAAIDALARAAQAFPRLKDVRAYPHWLYRIAARCALDAVPAAAVAPAAGERADAGRGPVETLVAAERAERVRGAVDALPQKLREPVYLHHVEGLAYRAVADVLGVGLGTVSRRIARAHDLLRERLGETT
ncbi:MAG: RNA polymerase sigma factor [Planctomycetota bacterium]|jgi:RNA polymerase sigma-70 factor (ECF subfamily)